MKFSVIMTVYNRPQLVLMNTLVKLGANDWEDGEIIVVDDGSRLPYGPMRESFKHLPVRWVDCPQTECYSLDGTNNPVRAWNLGLKEAKGDFLFPMSSDIIAPRARSSVR